MDLETLDRGSLAGTLREIEAVWHGDRELDCHIWYALGRNWVHPRWTNSWYSSWRKHVEEEGFKKAWLSDHVFDVGIPPISASLTIVYEVMAEFLPQHDGITISRDPSGVGAEIGNWNLSHPKGPQTMEYHKSSHATEELALLSAMFTVIIQKKDGLCVTQNEFDRECRRRNKARKEEIKKNMLFA